MNAPFDVLKLKKSNKKPVGVLGEPIYVLLQEKLIIYNSNKSTN
jgi:hypothetical protein